MVVWLSLIQDKYEAIKASKATPIMPLIEAKLEGIANRIVAEN